jgi:ABC-2 type transport system permease protein
MSSLAKYAKVFDIGLQNTFVYRWNFLLRSFFGIVPLVGTVFIWQAVFEARAGAIGGYDFSRMIWYFMLTILFSNLVTPTDDEWQIASDIRDGQISAFLTKPLDYLAYRLTIFGSHRALYSVVTLLPVGVIFFALRSHITLPHHAAAWPLAALSLGMSALIQFFIAYSMAMFAFWILEISTIVFILYSFEYFLSGQLFPMDIMPMALQSVLKWLPFTYELYFPVAVFMENVSGRALWEGLAIQALWVLATWAVARAMFRRGVRHYQAVGG